jgi:hypothetical protein
MNYNNINQIIGFLEVTRLDNQATFKILATASKSGELLDVLHHWFISQLDQWNSGCLLLHIANQTYRIPYPSTYKSVLSYFVFWDSPFPDISKRIGIVPTKRDNIKDGYLALTLLVAKHCKGILYNVLSKI